MSLSQNMNPIIKLYHYSLKFTLYENKGDFTTLVTLLLLVSII